MQAAGEDEARPRKVGENPWTGFLDRRAPGRKSGSRQPQSEEARTGDGTVSEACVYPRQRLAHLFEPRRAGPTDRVVLAGEQRNARLNRLARRPPGAEHVRMDELGP